MHIRIRVFRVLNYNYKLHISAYSENLNILLYIKGVNTAKNRLAEMNT